MPIHEMFDSSKGAMADVRHRVVFHSAFGIFVIEKIFGSTRVNSDGKTYSVRDIGEQHVMEDLGTIPSLEQWMKDAPIEPWMMGKKEVKNTTHIPFDIPPIQTTPISPGLGDVFIDGIRDLQERFKTAPQPTGIPNWPEIIVKD